MTFKTEQKAFWTGDFGDLCFERNCNENLAAHNLTLFREALQKCVQVKSILEFGANIGLSLMALKELLPEVVLIHIEPTMLHQVYDRLYRYSNRYILICEYYNPVPVEVVYRGHSAKLFKRDLRENSSIDTQISGFSSTDSSTIEILAIRSRTI